MESSKAEGFRVWPGSAEAAIMLQSQEQNSHVQRAWYANAEFWDERMAEGNDFFNVLVWPAVVGSVRGLSIDSKARPVAMTFSRTEVLLGGVQRGIFGNPIGVQLKLDHFATPSRRTSRRIPPSSPRLNKMSLPSGDPGSEVEVQSQAKCVHVAWG